MASSVATEIKPTFRFEEDGHKYFLDDSEIPSVTQVIGAVLDGNAGFYTEESRMRGTVVHLACELDDLGQLDESALDDEIMPYLAAYQKFKQEHLCEWEGIEERLCHETYGFAGTIDRRGIVVSNRTVLDIKTGAKSDIHDIQLAAYVMLLNHTHTHRFILQLDDDGTYSLHQICRNTLRGDINIFLSALAVFTWKKGRF